MHRRKNYNHTEEAFLLSTFSEFVKCWKSSKKSRLFIESVNGMAFMNFSVFLGNPSDAHSPPNPHPQRRHPSPKENKRKKSSKKIQRDNERAAKYQENKRKELAAASAASGNPTPITSTKVHDKTRDGQQAPASAANGYPPQTQTLSPAEPSVRAASVEFSFASPVAEDKTSDAMEGVSDPQLSPENLRHQPEDPPSLTRSHNEEIVREDAAGPILENITISEEVQQENKDTVSKPRLRLTSSEPCILHAFNEGNQEPFLEEFLAAFLAQCDQIKSDLKQQNNQLDKYLLFFLSLSSTPTTSSIHNSIHSIFSLFYSLFRDDRVQCLFVIVDIVGGINLTIY